MKLTWIERELLRSLNLKKKLNRKIKKLEIKEKREDKALEKELRKKLLV